METPQINDHNKKEYPPMHSAEHLLNATMVKMFGCPRSRNAHIEKKKSKCDYLLMQEPSAEQISAIETAVNEVIGKNLPVTVEYMTQAQAADIVDLSKLPADATDTLRIVRVGDYDACACAGDHVQSRTSWIFLQVRRMQERHSFPPSTSIPMATNSTMSSSQR